MGADAGLVAFLLSAGPGDNLSTETDVSEAENGTRQLSLCQQEQDEGYLYSQNVQNSAHTASYLFRNVERE